MDRFGNRLSTGTSEEASNYGFSVTLFSRGCKLVGVTPWVSIQNNLTLFVVWQTLRPKGHTLRCAGC